MNVLHYANYGAPYEGNFIQSLKCLNRRLRSHGEQMYLMLEKKPTTAAWHQDVSEGGLPISYIDTNGSGCVSQIRRFIEKNQIDVIHLHFAMLSAVIRFQLAVLGRKTKLVVHFHNHLLPPKIFIKKLAMTGCKLCCCSQSVADGLREQGFSEKNICTAENAIDFTRLDRIDQDVLASGMFDTDRFKLLMFGFDYERKGVDVVMKAIESLPGEDKGIQLYISVSSRLEQVKKRILEDFGSMPQWVTILPPCNEIATYYKNTDAFISASREEGFCYALIEAAYCGTEIIASKIPAQKDLKLSNAHWFESGDVEGLRQILMELPSREKSAQKLDAQREEVVRRYDLSKWAQTLDELYHHM